MEIGTYQVKENEIDKHNYTFKNMTDEEIQKQSVKYENRLERRPTFRKAFADGAEWAKEQAEKECPSEEQIKKILQIKHYGPMWNNGEESESEKAKWEKEVEYIKEHWND